VTAVLIRPAVVPLFHTSNWVSAGKVETHHLLPPEEEEEERPYISMFLTILTNWGHADKTKQIRLNFWSQNSYRASHIPPV